MQNQTVIPKKQLVIFAGLAGVGKRTTIDKLVSSVSNATKFEKDLINNVFLPLSESATEQYKTLYPVINSKTYDLIIQQALDNLKGNTHKVAILQAYFGDKVASKYANLISSEEYQVKIIYLHCSGFTQEFRILARGLSRDSDKVLGVKDLANISADTPDPFPAYRKKHLENHLKELARIPAENLLVVDTESETSLDENVATIIQFLQIDSPTINITPLEQINPTACNIPLDEAKFGINCDEFKQYLAQAKNVTLDKADAAYLLEPASLGTLMLHEFYTVHNSVRDYLCQLTEKTNAALTPRPKR